MNKKIIKDPMGQWKHPGKITQIPSGNITMHGVDYPVLGIDNMGNSMMMQPNMNYQFPGHTVTEYPMMQDGGIPGYNPTTGAHMLAAGVSSLTPQQLQTMNYRNTGDNNWYNDQTGRFYKTYSPGQPGYIAPMINTPTTGQPTQGIIQGQYTPSYTASTVGSNMTTVDTGFKTRQFPILGSKKQGGEIDPDKAREILEDGSVYNRPLTQKQIDYFSKVAGVTLDDEGEIIDNDSEESEEQEEFRRGGSYLPHLRKPKRKSGRNIKSSINYLLARNEMLFGSQNNTIYDPSMKDGGDCGCKKMTHGGDCEDFTPGQSDDNFLNKKKADFLQYLTRNNMEAIANQEADRIDGLMKKYGGEAEFIKGFYELPVYLMQDGGGFNYFPMNYRDQTTITYPDTSSNGPIYKPKSNYPIINMDPNQMQDQPITSGPAIPQGIQTTGSFDWDPTYPGAKTPQPTIKTKRKLDNESMANWIITGMNAITSFANAAQDRKAKERLKSMQNADSQFYSTPAGDRGDYDINSGMFRPNDMVPVQFAGQNFGAQGSNYRYQEGGEYVLSDDEIAEILRNGGEIEYID